MESAIIVSSTDKGAAFFTEMLNAASVTQIATVQTCGEARRLVLDRDFDLVIVNAPLRDEFGEGFSRQIAANGAQQVILVAKSELYDAVSAACEEDGVLTISKPVNRALFWATLKLAASTLSRIRRVHAENSRLRQKIEDIRIVDRAKCLLISYHGMNEQEAHRCIEKQAMDMRTTRRAIAEGIIKTYEY